MHACGGCGKSVDNALLSKYKREIQVEHDGSPHHCPSSFTIEQHLQRIGDLIEKIYESLPSPCGNCDGSH